MKSAAPVPALAAPPPPPGPESCCAVYVTYHPDACFPERVAIISPQVGHILVVDNQSNPAARAMLRRLAATGQIELVENTENLGMATALNQGAARARELGYAWLLTFDQDSLPQSDLVPELARVYGLHPQPRKLGMIGANYHNPVLHADAVAFAPGAPEYRAVTTTITSGALVNLAVYAEVGPFRDDLFIDSVDLEYSLRLRTRGYLVIVSRKTLLIHAIGRPKQRRLLGRNPILTNHPPLRRYYIARNRLAVAKSYAFKEPRFICGEMVRIGGDLVLVLLEEGWWKKVRAMGLGLWHGLWGKMGKLPEGRWTDC